MPYYDTLFDQLSTMVSDPRLTGQKTTFFDHQNVALFVAEATMKSTLKSTMKSTLKSTLESTLK